MRERLVLVLAQACSLDCACWNWDRDGGFASSDLVESHSAWRVGWSHQDYRAPVTCFVAHLARRGIAGMTEDVRSAVSSARFVSIQHPLLETGDIEDECNKRTHIFCPGIAAVHTSDFETLRAFVSCVIS